MKKNFNFSFKMGKRHERFPKKDHIKGQQTSRQSASTITRDFQINATKNRLYIQRRLKFKKTDNTKHWKNVRS